MPGATSLYTSCHRDEPPDFSTAFESLSFAPYGMKSQSTAALEDGYTVAVQAREHQNVSLLPRAPNTLLESPRARSLKGKGRVITAPATSQPKKRRRKPIVDPEVIERRKSQNRSSQKTFQDRKHAHLAAMQEECANFNAHMSNAFSMLQDLLQQNNHLYETCGVTLPMRTLASVIDGSGLEELLHLCPRLEEPAIGENFTAPNKSPVVQPLPLPIAEEGYHYPAYTASAPDAASLWWSPAAHSLETVNYENYTWSLQSQSTFYQPHTCSPGLQLNFYPDEAYYRPRAEEWTRMPRWYSHEDSCTLQPGARVIPYAGYLAPQD